MSQRVLHGSSKAPLLRAAFLLFIGETPISGFRVGTSGWSSRLSGQFIFQSTAEHSGRVFSAGLCACTTCCWSNYSHPPANILDSADEHTHVASRSFFNVLQRGGNPAAGAVLVVCVAAALGWWASGYSVHAGSPATSTQRRLFGRSSFRFVQERQALLFLKRGNI